MCLYGGWHWYHCNDLYIFMYAYKNAKMYNLIFPYFYSISMTVSSQCCEGGVISPTTCVYITNWLAIPEDHATNENYTW
jgi:hypothetical protein